MRIGLRIAARIHRVARWTAKRSWRARELLTAAGFDEDRLLLEVPERGLEADHGRVKTPASLS